MSETIVRLDYAAHTAYLDPVTGQGLLIMPAPSADVWLPGAPSLQEASWEAVIRDLDARGWEPSEPDDLSPWVHVGTDRQGRDAIGLLGRDPIVSDPTIEEMATADAELMRLAGVTPHGSVTP